MTRAEYLAATPEERQAAVIRAVAADARNRRLLSPAEAMNVLTVGSLDDDDSEPDPKTDWSLAYESPGLPSPLNAQGMGYRRSIKPEIMAPGGRVAVRTKGDHQGAVLDLYQGPRPPGQLVAAPGQDPGRLDSVRYSRGTSNAAALTSRSAGFYRDLLESLRDEPGGDVLASVPDSVWLKALLTHGCSWGDGGELLEEILRTDDRRGEYREYATRLVGYGCLDPKALAACTPFSVTALSGGVLRVDQGHLHRIPLPPSLSGRRCHRRLAVTLAWLSPVNPRHQGWRRAELWFTPDPNRPARSRDPLTPLGLSRSEADWRAVQRGTLQHEVFEGEAATAFVDGECCDIQVSCRADAGACEESVPYALVTTLQVAEELGVEIYDEVRVRVQEARVVVAPSG